MIKKLLFLILIVNFTILHAFSFDLDMTVDDDIRKNYNSSQLQKDTKTEDLETLPGLPDKLKNENSIPQPTISTANTKPIPNTIINMGNIKIPKWTSFQVVNSTRIDDTLIKGQNVKFKTTQPIYDKNYTIPVNTIFSGEVIESHQPQITCNGGLVAIKINSMTYKNQTIPMNAYITKANGKKIFLNNIKGERKYIKTMWKKGNWGRTIFSNMCSLTVKLGAETSTLVLSPFPFLYGTICLGANAITSPICAFFSKGGHISIPAGSTFRIKLLEDAYIN